MKRVVLVGLVTAACGHAEPGPPPRDTPTEAAAPSVQVEPDVVTGGFTGPPASLRCPSGQEHGCMIIVRVPRAGGAAMPFTEEIGLINDMDVAGRELLLASQFSFSTLVAYPIDGVDARMRDDRMRLLDASGSRIRRITTVGHQVVVALESGLIAAPLDGSARTQLSATTHAYFVASDGTRVLWTESSGANRAGRIMEAPLTGGASRVLVDGEDAPQDLALDDDGVYWLNWGNGYFDPPGSVRALDKGASQPRTLAADQRAPRVLTSDREAVYFVLDGPEGRTLRSVPKRGGDVVELVLRTGREGHRDNLDAVQVLGEYVYFNAGDAIWQVGSDGSNPVVVAEVESERADVVTFVVDASSVFVAARIYDPAPPEPLDE